MSDSIDFTRLQLALPRTGALLFAGSALYIGFIDPRVRLSHENEKQQLIHWLTMYNTSKFVMAPLALISALLGINAYRLTEERLWLYGSLASFAIIPFTLFGIMGINKKLFEDEKAARKGQINDGVASRLVQWVWRHRVRALLSVVAAGLYYVAEGRTNTK